MLKFLVSDNGVPTADRAIRSAYLVGSDHSALRGEITFENGVILCRKHDGGPAALALPQAAGDCGKLILQTCLLPEREEPYLLALEIARHRLMMLYQKLEDWGMYDLDGDHSVSRSVELARQQFIEALCQRVDQSARAEELARQCLITAMACSETLAFTHAKLLLDRRKATGSIPRHVLGCGVFLDHTSDEIRAGLLSSFDYFYLPTPWRAVAPHEGAYRWETLDNWCDWAQRNRLPIMAGPVIRFDPAHLPDWVYMWEHDFGTIRDLLYEHIECLVSRYRRVVGGWNVASGLNVNQHFTLNIDQLLELSRMSAMLVRKIQPQARILIEVREPFGEYCNANQHSIPPLLYADRLIQGATHFDGFAIRFAMGQPEPGQYARDVMQLSSLMDQFSVFGKPLHLIISAPSDKVTSKTMSSVSKEPIERSCGIWREPWSPSVQSGWLEALCQIGMSKPYVESVTWQEFADHPSSEVPFAGLIGHDMQPKEALRNLTSFRQALTEREPGDVTDHTG